MALNGKKKKAIDLYLSGKSKKDAMLGAGYSASTADTKHSDVFGDPEVVAEIERRQKIASTRTDISLEWALSQLKKIVEANMGDLIEIDESTGEYKINMARLSPELKYALTNFTVDEMQEGRGPGAEKFKRLRIGTLDKVRALELIIRHGGLSKEKVVVQVEGDLVERLNRGRQRVAASED